MYVILWDMDNLLGLSVSDKMGRIANVWVFTFGGAVPSAQPFDHLALVPKELLGTSKWLRGEVLNVVRLNSFRRWVNVIP